MKYKRLIIIFLLAILSLTACSSTAKLEINSEVDEIKVSNFIDFGNWNEDYHMFFEEKEHIKTFVDAIEKARPVSGDVDMPEADYNLLLCFNEENSEGYHLWISEKSSIGTIMKIDDTTTAYTLTKSSVNKISNLLFK